MYMYGIIIRSLVHNIMIGMDPLIRLRMHDSGRLGIEWGGRDGDERRR